MKGYINPYILKLIEQAIYDESASYLLYTLLSEKYGLEIFNNIALDEMKHKKMLNELYTDLSSKVLPEKEIRLEADINRTMEEILNEQITDKAQAATMYRTLYFAMPNNADKNILFEIMSDEMMHVSEIAGV